MRFPLPLPCSNQHHLASRLLLEPLLPGLSETPLGKLNDVAIEFYSNALSHEAL